MSLTASTASGPSTVGGRTKPRAREPIAQHRVGGERGRERRQSDRGAPGSALDAGRHEAHVRQAAGQRRDADVVATADVHLAEGRHAVDPLPRTRRSPSGAARGVTREAERERQRRMAAVGGNRHGGANRSMLSRSIPPRRPTRGGRSIVLDDRLADGGAVHELDAGRHGLLEQRPVQILATDGAAVQARRVAALNRRPAFAGDEHAVQRSPAVSAIPARSEPSEHRERAGIERVAAQLGPRKRRAIEQADARARPREHRGRDRSRRARTDDQDVEHGHRNGNMANGMAMANGNWQCKWQIWQSG